MVSIIGFVPIIIYRVRPYYYLLKTYFDNPANSKLNEKDVYIFIKFVPGQIGELIQIAEEIDEQYGSGNDC